MATEQVLQWINRDVSLSKAIHSFETDFANGYLFGEILCQFGVYDDIRIFSKKTNKETKVNNFFLVEDALRALKIRFDGKMTHSIMQEERGAALRLLFQLKLAIQKREGPPADEQEAMTMTGLKAGTVQRKFAKNLDTTNQMAGSIRPRLTKGKDIRTSNQRMQDSHLIKFEVAMKNHNNAALAQADDERTLIKTIQQRKRGENRSKLQENQEFMKDWEYEGRQNWKGNQKIRADNITRQKYFEDREVNLFKAKLSRELDDATHEMHNGVDEFNRNLQKLGIDTNINIDDAIQRQQEKQGIPPGQIQNFSFPATMNKIKETKKQSDFAGKERERRRRKLAVDQATIKTRLDQQKNEDQLLSRLLEQQTEEQNNAYSDQRMIKCKHMVTKKRRARALDVEAKRQARYREMEEEGKKEARQREAIRKVEIEEKKVEYGAIRKANRKMKRQVNIEIASGVVDLIMDMADEVYDTTLNQPGKKLTKVQWREFSQLFIDGKKCSLRHVKKSFIDEDSARASESEGHLLIPSNQSVAALVNAFSHEPALHDFYQYISNSGSFNLDQLRGDLLVHWGEQLKIDQFLQSEDRLLVQNQQFGKILEDLYRQQEMSLMGRDAMTESKVQVQHQSSRATQLNSTIEIREAVDEEDEEHSAGAIPSELPIKLAILGRAFSGKKTIAAQLVEKYGGEKNIHVFNMDEIIKEALDYITPKKANEDESPKKAAKKGKQEEVVNVDIFEGKQPAAYKKIAAEMKAQFFADYEGDNMPQQVDLPNLVFDDAMLVNLFIERLRLQYEGQDVSISQAELEAGISREKELVQQLAEIDDNQVDAKADKKAKGGGKGGKPSDADQLREELESIQKVRPRGWILLDFPRNLNQMKLLETGLSGYVSKTDHPKSDSQSKYEAWAKVATPSCLVDQEQTGQISAIPSGLDGVIILETPDEECTRRSQNRKIDSQTQIIYHMESEAPEDQKIVDRLQDYTDEAGDQERMQKISTGFAQSIRAIKQWLTRFGLANAEDGTRCDVQLDMDIALEPIIDVAAGKLSQRAIAELDGSIQHTDENINDSVAADEAKSVKDPWKDKQTVLDQVNQKVDEVMKYRQHQFQCKRQAVSQAIQERERLEAEAEAARIAEEERKRAEEERKKAEEEEKARVEQEAATAAAAAATAAATAREGSEQAPSRKGASQDQDASVKQSQLSIEVPLNDDDEVKEEAMKTHSSRKSMQSKHQSVGGTSKSVSRFSKLHQRVQEINDKQKLYKWEEMLTTYYSEGMQEFNSMRILRQRVCRSLNETQQKFVNYLGRASDQQRRINEYCQNYNRFSQEFPDLIGNPETSKELQNRIQILSKQLWENIKERKDEAMKERLSYMEGGWVQIESAKLCKSVSNLIGIEFKRFQTISAVVTGHVVNDEVDLDDVAKKLTERGVEPYIENQQDKSFVGQSPLLLEVAQTILVKVDALFNEQFVLSLDQKILQVLNIERQNFSMRLNLLFTWALLILHEISSQALQVFDVLDDWVVISVKLENQVCQQAMKRITESVEQNQMHLETLFLEKINLQRHIEVIEFHEGLPSYMVEAKPVYTIQQARFSQESLSLIYRQFRQHQVDTNLIDSQTFLTLTLLNIQHGVLPNVWRYVPFESILDMSDRFLAKPLTDDPDGDQRQLFRKRSAQENKAQERKFMDWRKAFLALCLMAGRIPTQAQKQKYFERLRAKQAICHDAKLTRGAFIKIDAWFDKLESSVIPTPHLMSPSPSARAGMFSASNISGAGSPSPFQSKEQINYQQHQLNSSVEDVDDDDDESGDQERLEAIKGFLFDTYRVQNDEMVVLDEFITDIESVFCDQPVNEMDERTLYQTLLNMPPPM